MSCRSGLLPRVLSYRVLHSLNFEPLEGRDWYVTWDADTVPELDGDYKRKHSSHDSKFVCYCRGVHFDLTKQQQERSPLGFALSERQRIVRGLPQLMLTGNWE
jgi:hypothetical protein